jgi:arginase family enzyme
VVDGAAQHIDVAADLVEVAPACDGAEITALAGATMVWEYLAPMMKAAP